MKYTAEKGGRGSIARWALGVAGTTAIAASLIPVGQVEAVGEGGWGWSYCYQYSYDDGMTRNSNFNQNAWTASWANIGNVQVSGSGSGSGPYWQWSYAWVYGNQGAVDCRPSVELLRLRASVTANALTVTGAASERGTRVTVSAPAGGTLCTVTVATVPDADGGYPFSCTVPWTGGPGSFALPVRGEKFGANPVSTSVPLTVVAPLPPAAVTTLTATPNPTAGPVTVAGLVNRSDATITVRTPDGRTLCTTSALESTPAGLFAWSCAGSLPASDGPTTLTATMTTPAGDRATASVQVTKTSTPTPPSTTFAIFNATASPNPTSGPVTVAGFVNRANAPIEVRDGATVVCTTKTAAVASANGKFAFSCNGTLTGAPGERPLVVKATSPNNASASVTANVSTTLTTAPVSPSPVEVLGASASPNPTAGPVTVSGSTSRPGAAITVRNPDGSTLCTTTSATAAVGGTYAFSCAGTLPGADGPRTLTVSARTPDGGQGSVPVSVTKTSTPTPPSTTFAIFNATASPNPTSGPVTVAGFVNRANAPIEVRDGATVVCTTKTAAVASANGKFAFSCNGTLTGAPGERPLVVKATSPNNASASVTANVSTTLTGY